MSCLYLGAKVGDSQPDIGKSAFGEDLLEFEWTLRSDGFEWVDVVSMRCKHLTQGVPLPRCTVTKQRLIDAASSLAQKHSKDNSFDVSCRYEGALEAGSTTENLKLKDRVSVRDVARFHWEVVWPGGRQVATSHVRAYKALEDNRSVPLPDGWTTALRALGVLANTRETSMADLQLGITELRAFLLGLPKPVGPADVGMVPGACVLLVDNGRPLQFALLANIRGSEWYCHAGGDVFSKSSPWSWDRHTRKDIVAESWARAPEAPRPNRRQRAKKVAPVDLRQQVREFPNEWALLVAEATWYAEGERAKHEQREPDLDALAAMFEGNPFKWEVEGHASRADVFFRVEVVRPWRSTTPPPNAIVSTMLLVGMRQYLPVPFRITL